MCSSDLVQKRNRRQEVSKRRLLLEERNQTMELDAIQNNTSGLSKTITPTIPDQPKIQFNSKDKVYTFSRSYVYGTITGSTTVDQAGALSFTLSALPGATEFTSLFDVYRIQQLHVDFVALTGGPYASPLTTVIDYDDANAVASLNELLEYQTAMTTSAGANVSRVLQPRASMAVYSGAFTSFATTPVGLWIDCASSTVQYYGIKYYLPALAGGTSTALYSIRVRAIVQFKTVR